ncbi:MAG TPA: endonuclease domain-containing protein [Gemmatimonadales bacterium]|nr:endonuclease domain-containing protein [Gemmatimonadales bacterium]
MRLRRRLIPRRKLQHARALRQDPTLAERRAWDLLRDRRMFGLKFRRQHVIAGFVVDFYCAELRLVLELDGPGHTDAIQRDYDAARTAHLESRGLHVIRLKNDAAREAALRSLLEDLTRRSPSPQRGEGVRG